MKNFLIIGQMGSGKDTVSEYLCNYYTYTLVKLGTKIRKEVHWFSRLLGTEDNTRKLLQEYGEGMRDIFGEDVWCEYLYDRIKDYLPFHSIVIGDGRQQHEYDYWTKKDFIVIAVDSDADVRASRLSDRDGDSQESRMNHDTEEAAARIIKSIKDKELPGIYVQNNGTKHELYNQLDKIMKDLQEDSYE